MSLLRKINIRAKTVDNSGFGTNADAYGGRLVNKDGQPNIEKKGVGFFEQISWYHTMIAMPRWKFLITILLFYISVNFIFALIYYSIGVEHLVGINAADQQEKFAEAFFFSAQTYTTVGYGRISPIGILTSTVAALEALLGLLTFAIATGLFYARFSKAKAHLRFSKNALIAPYKDGIALMLRVAPYKNNVLTDAETKLTLGLTLENDGQVVNKFYPLSLEYDKVNALTLSWTIVHPINAESPLYNFTKEDYANTKGEIMIYMKAFDDMYSNTVATRTSYTFKELIIGAKFSPMYYRDHDNNKTLLDIDKLNSYTSADINL